MTMRRGLVLFGVLLVLVLVGLWLAVSMHVCLDGPVLWPWEGCGPEAF
jgi:hypothetical protein